MTNNQNPCASFKSIWHQYQLLTIMIERADIEKIASEITKEYVQSPKRLVEDARTEVNLVESEQGRFVLELLQNADDAQVSENGSDLGYFGNAEIVFEVTEKYLYCANGGYPLSKQGLESICRAFLSPKRKNTPVIGFKGIGFKSVLSFTDKPDIFWHDGAVSFSREKTLEFLKSQAPEALTALDTYKNDVQVPVLRFPHLLDFEREVANDSILARLFSTSATVFRFPFSSEDAKRLSIHKLNDIETAMVLFMNKLAIVKIIVDGTHKTYTISKGNEINREKRGSTFFAENQANIDDGAKITHWHLVSGTYSLPQEIREKLPFMWKETESIKISFAIAVDDNGRYVPLSGPQFLHVFFPTQERTPFQMLLHGTFRTNVDRRLLIQDDILNEFALTKTVELLRDKVLCTISANIEEPGQILDFVCPPAESSASTVEEAIWNRVVTTLASFQFVPNRDNTKPLTPNAVLMSPLKTDIGLIKSVFQEDYQERLCYDSIDSNENRRNVLEKMGATQFNVLDLPEILERSFKPDTKWVATAYSVLDKVHNYLKAVDSSKDTDFVKEVKKRKLLLLSDNTQASPESTSEVPIFFPPLGNTPLPPRDLKLRFLDGKAVDEYRKMNSLTIRGTFLYQGLNVDEYGAISLITKTVIPAIKEFWEKWPAQKLFEPEKLLEFMRTLLQGDLPNDAKIKAICRAPVPVKGDEKYAPAYSVYGSKEWTNNDNLEFIFGASNFLSPPLGLSEEEKQKWGKFYQWLGVSWLPRIIPQYEAFADSYYHYWYSGQCTCPHSSLPFWEDYTKSLSEEYSKFGDENPLSKSSVRMTTSWCLDRFDEVTKDRTKCLRLLAVIAGNWDSHYSRFGECDIHWKNSREWYWKESKITSYFYWKLKNTNWLPASNFEIWGFRKPTETFLKSKSVFDKLGDLVPYMQVEDGSTTSFLLKLGVRNSLDLVTPDDWWRIALDIPRLFPADAEVINPIYREILKIKGMDEDSEPKREFMANGKLLVLNNGAYQFEDREEVWYSKNEETGHLFGPKLPMFSIKNDENKGAAIKRIFEINMLDDSVEPNVELGEEEDSASRLFQGIIEELKPFILARVNKQRPSKEKEDASLLRRLMVKALKSLKVSYTLNISSNTLIVTSNGGVFLDEDKNILYVDVSKFGAKDLASIQANAQLASEIGNHIASYLDIDLADSFILLTQTRDEQRPSILQRVGIYENEITRMKELLKQQVPEKPPVVVLQSQSTPESSEPSDVSMSYGQSSVQQTAPVLTQQIPLELWHPDELEFGDAVEVQPNSSNAQTAHGGAGGGNSQPAHVTDKQERSKIDQAGIKCVEKYEKWRHKKEHGCASTIESREKARCGYDILSKCEKEERLIEVKSSRGEVQVIELTAPEWDAARRSSESKSYYLYRVTNLAKSNGKEPDIIIISEPYNNLLGEPTRFKVRLGYLKGKKKVVHLKKVSEPVTENDV